MSFSSKSFLFATIALQRVYRRVLQHNKEKDTIKNYILSIQNDKQLVRTNLNHIIG